MDVDISGSGVLVRLKILILLVYAVGILKSSFLGNLIGSMV